MPEMRKNLTGASWWLSSRVRLSVQGTWVQPQGWENPLEKDMATRAVFLLGNPTEEPGGLQSVGSKASQTRLSN